MNITEQLSEVVGPRLKENEPMSKHVNFRIGGPARWMVEIRTIEELQHVLHIAKEEEVNYFVFGGGSNMLVSDEGFDGIAIKIGMRSYDIRGTHVRAESGVLSAALARATATHGLKGFTWAISLPGTIGGAVRGNAGCFGGEMKDSVTQVDVLRDGSIVTLSNEALQFGYRESVVKKNDDIVLAAEFDFEEGDSNELREELDDNLMKRKESQPFDGGSAGCLFKNIELTDEELQRLSKKIDIPSEMQSARRISAGWLIDKLDLKGTQIGDAKISQVHGNFVVNTGAATADHVVQLIALVKTRARDEFGVGLREEVQYIGF